MYKSVFPKAVEQLRSTLLVDAPSSVRWLSRNNATRSFSEIVAASDDPSAKEKFHFNERLFYWYPGHMVKSIRLMRSKLKSIDLVVEVRDARIPFSSVNPRFEFLVTPRNIDRLIVYNKSDLADAHTPEIVCNAFLRHRGQKVLFTSLKDKKAVRQILQHAGGEHWFILSMDCQEGSSFFLESEIARRPQNRDKAINALIVGMPNVGKSSLINSLREIGVKRGKAAKVGPEAGVTRQIQERIRIFEDPPIFLVDTPGIMDPYITNPHQAMKIALTGGTKDRLVVEEHVADYLLFFLNQRKASESNHLMRSLSELRRYLSFLNLPPNVAPPRNAEELLPLLALRIGAFRQGGLPDISRALNFWIRGFREGKWGRFTLDDMGESETEAFFGQKHDRHKEAEQRALARVKERQGTRNW
ncbi:P-loop containing nucleoside triphosphate hydrolase protein [Gonapodya prolifera JEL478]|uniref:p-loop containing nucleoside triphosphate hydrolase protein n=1 Tax=Gonapodya prolifera (strain JEL478) TaxID=1344416 RepID=A0A139ALE8_GONPJ|nr:P-loop containing nucleoside triphosphate hydrolase protein [Gonapodya prolifera JEL478]|eukprot:KXS17580.1 P-loop containing nucleoside triphosphate hydrolase protein [Gonapodya prolifera JEL478]